MKITQDEALLIFYKADKDGDGLWNLEEMSRVLTPSDPESLITMQLRNNIYGAVTDPNKIFCEATRL